MWLRGAIINTAHRYTSASGQVKAFPFIGFSARDPYAEVYTSWHLGSAPSTRRHTTLTRISLIGF